MTGPDMPGHVAEYLRMVRELLRGPDPSAAQLELPMRRRQQLGLSEDQVRWVHAEAMTKLMAGMTGEPALGEQEAEILRRAAARLRGLGWVPGDPPDPVAQLPGRRRGFLARIFGVPRPDW